jgi:hypothetical protein
MGNTLCCSSTNNVNEMMGGGLPPKFNATKVREPMNPDPNTGEYDRF